MTQISNMTATEFVDKSGSRYSVSFITHPVYGLEAHCTNILQKYTVIYTYAEFLTKNWEQIPKSNI